MERPGQRAARPAVHDGTAEGVEHSPGRPLIRQFVHSLQEAEQFVMAGIGIGPLEARMQVRHGGLSSAADRRG